MAYEKELEIALLAVQRAAILTKAVFHEKAKGTVSKDDKSPVTIGDFGAQALITHAIHHAFPEDGIIGEEEASSLRSNPELSAEIWAYVNSTSLNDSTATDLIGGPIPSESAMLDAIDLGNSAGGAKGRFWALDPIDGTKGFLRGGQYSVCLGLVVDGDVKVGVLGCPNLPISDSERLFDDIGFKAIDTEGKFGVLFSAVQSQGATSRPLTAGSLSTSVQLLHMRTLSSVSSAIVCESVEAGHSSKSDNVRIVSILGISKPPIQMDSQAKYGSIARGAGDLYLRLPTSATYQEKVWDHAAGDLIVRESGGMVTDIHGNRLDFSQGRLLKRNKGVVAAPEAVHAQVLKAVLEALAAKEKAKA